MRIAITLATAALCLWCAPPTQAQPRQAAPPLAGTQNPATYGRGPQRTGAPLASSLLFDDKSTISEMRFGDDGHTFTFRHRIRPPIYISGSCSNSGNPSLIVEGIQGRLPPGDGPLGFYVDHDKVRSYFEIDNEAPSVRMGIYPLKAVGVPEFVRLLASLPYGRIVTIGFARKDRIVPVTQYVAPGAVTAHQLMFGAPDANLEMLRTVDSLCQTLVRR